MKCTRFIGKTTTGQQISSEAPETANMELNNGVLVWNWQNEDGVQIERTVNLEHFVVYDILYGVQAEIEE